MQLDWVHQNNPELSLHLKLYYVNCIYKVVGSFTCYVRYHIHRLQELRHGYFKI